MVRERIKFNGFSAFATIMEKSDGRERCSADS